MLLFVPCEHGMHFLTCNVCLLQGIADLQRQLREAQEERDDALKWKLVAQMYVAIGAAVNMRVRAERHDAIKRGAAVWNEVALLDDTTINLWRAKAEAAEEKLAEQRARAGELEAEALDELHVKDHWETHCKLCDMAWPVGDEAHHEEGCLLAEAQEEGD